jgi:hypothetical protein
MENLKIEHHRVISKNNDFFSITDVECWQENMHIEISYYIENDGKEDCDTLTVTANVLGRYLEENDLMSTVFESANEDNSDIVQGKFKFKTADFFVKSCDSEQLNDILKDFVISKISK